MKRIVIVFLASVFLLTVLPFMNWAGQNQQGRTVYYDTFNGPWLDPTKWVFNPGTEDTSLERIREIQNGRLRLEVRAIGAMNSDFGFQYDDSGLNFTNPNAVNSITADVRLGRVNGVACSTNYDQSTRILVTIWGNFFNTASYGDPAYDVMDEVYFDVDPSNPKTMNVANWMTGSGLGVGTPIGSYPIGTPLTVTNSWDKANHQFISVVQVTGDSGTAKKVVVPYSVSDLNLPVYPNKGFGTGAYGANCTSAQTFAEVEAFFDNVMINVPPPRADQ